jgi:hypothetical protein
MEWVQNPVVTKEKPGNSRTDLFTQIKPQLQRTAPDTAFKFGANSNITPHYPGHCGHTDPSGFSHVLKRNCFRHTNSPLHC